MKIKELIEELSKLDPELPVIVARDQEGNGFSELGCIEVSKYTEDSYDQVEVHHPDDWDDNPESKACLVIWP